MDKLTLNGFQLERRFCSACDSFQWHVKRADGTWECLSCRARDLEETSPQSTLPEPYQRAVRAELRKMPTWKLEEAYGNLKSGEATGVEIVEENRAYAINAAREILYERGKLPHETGVFPMPPNEGPPFPRRFGIRWPWGKGD